jgi:hypothetical protein
MPSGRQTGSSGTLSTWANGKMLAAEGAASRPTSARLNPDKVGPTIFWSDTASGTREPSGTVPWGSRSSSASSGHRSASRVRPQLPSELQVQRRQSRAKTERSCREQHVLHCWMIEEPDVRVSASFETRDDPHRASWMCAARYSAASAAAGMPGPPGPVRQTDTVVRPARPRRACSGSGSLLDLRSRTETASAACAAAAHARLRIFRISSLARVGLQPPHDRVVWMISNRSAVFGLRQAYRAWSWSSRLGNRGATDRS